MVFIINFSTEYLSDAVCVHTGNAHTRCMWLALGSEAFFCILKVLITQRCRNTKLANKTAAGRGESLIHIC